MIKKHFHIIILFCVLVITYWKVPGIFFQQDEWLGFSLMISNGLNIIFRGFGSSDIFHFIPLDQVLNYLAFQLFHLNYYLYNLAGLSIHFINSLLVYQIANLLIHKRSYSLLASIIFITSTVSAQLVMWPFVNLNMVSLAFNLIVLRLVLDYLEGKKSVKRSLLLAIFSSAAFLTLEYSLGLLLFIPVVIFSVNKFKNIKRTLSFLLPFIIISFSYLAIRLYPILFYTNSHSLASSDASGDFLFNTISLPIRYIGQVIIIQDQIVKISQFLSNLYFVQEQFIWAKVAMIGGIAYLLLNCLIWNQSREIPSNPRKKIVILVFFILSSSLPFVFLVNKGDELSLIPSRYLYYGMAGSALLLTLLLSLSNQMQHYFLRLLVISIVIVSIGGGVFYNWKKQNNLYQQGQVRLGILNSIKKAYPNLPNPVIIYTESDRSYYLLPPDEKILPFQSGFGQTLLMWYYEEENFPQAFLENKFLWEITDQDYKQYDGQGFGYFRDYELVKQAITDYNIPLPSIIAFSWDHPSGKLTDISIKTQERLKKDLYD